MRSGAPERWTLLTNGHKIWEWQYNKSTKWVYHFKHNAMDIYTPLAVPQFEHRPNCWTRSRVDVLMKELGNISL
jgi:hypothetical protein